MPRPWLPLHVGDYLSETGHLSTVQHGAYQLLQMHYWINGGLPDDDAQLASIVRLPLDEWMTHRLVLQTFFQDGWKHGRLDAELRRLVEIGIKRAKAGSKGGTVTSINWHRKR